MSSSLTRGKCFFQSHSRSHLNRLKASATREILDEFWPYFCEAGSDQFNQRCLSAFHTFLPVKVYPEEIDSTVGLWFNDLMEKWMNLDIPKQWEKRLVPNFFP